MARLEKVEAEVKNVKVSKHLGHDAKDDAIGRPKLVKKFVDAAM